MWAHVRIFDVWVESKNLVRITSKVFFVFFKKRRQNTLENLKIINFLKKSFKINYKIIISKCPNHETRISSSVSLHTRVCYLKVAFSSSSFNFISFNSSSSLRRDVFSPALCVSHKISSFTILKFFFQYFYTQRPEIYFWNWTSRMMWILDSFFLFFSSRTWEIFL